MSKRSKDALRRCCLAVPASNPKFIDKARELEVDMVFLDLEDAVARSKKKEAREIAASAIRTGGWGDKVLCVRVNGWQSRLTLRDLGAVVLGGGQRLDEVMLPKVESVSEVVALDLVLGQLEDEGGLEPYSIGIEVQIESPKGLHHVEEICSGSQRIEAVVFGPVDFAAACHMPVLTGGGEIASYPGDHFHYALAKILMAARIAGIQAIDGPYLKIQDIEGLRSYSRRAMSLGYDGKWAVHPNQIAVIEEVFRPEQEVFDRAVDILAAYERAVSAEERGAFVFGDEMIDEASRKMAEAFVRRGKGMKHS
jgi:citrate lyase subunit beta/citryl-CoA lyase